jgi:hypothetical protein
MKPEQLRKGERLSFFREGKKEGAFRKQGFGCMEGFYGTMIMRRVHVIR